ncbi:MAG: ABC transporter permease subunit [Opitutus sp.]|nr:ABC transporter permease subunit [Opitutus sp.]
MLYPYVYLTARVVFIMQGRNIADVARTLGAKPFTVFRRILLPVSRPAIIAGVALVLMETLNDFGASEYLGVRTLTLSVFTTWLNRGSLEGAAQIAMLMLVLVFALLMAEQWARRRQRFHPARATQHEGATAARATQWMEGTGSNARRRDPRAARFRHPDLCVRHLCISPRSPAFRSGACASLSSIASRPRWPRLCWPCSSHCC